MVTFRTMKALEIVKKEYAGIDLFNKMWKYKSDCIGYILDQDDDKKPFFKRDG